MSHSVAKYRMKQGESHLLCYVIPCIVTVLFSHRSQLFSIDLNRPIDHQRLMMECDRGTTESITDIDPAEVCSMGLSLIPTSISPFQTLLLYEKKILQNSKKGEIKLAFYPILSKPRGKKWKINFSYMKSYSIYYGSRK